MVICLQRGADLHMAQPMPLPTGMCVDRDYPSEPVPER